MLRLDDPTREKLEELSTHFEMSAAEIIRHLIAQATPEDFPRSWHMRAAERRVPQALQEGEAPRSRTHAVRVWTLWGWCDAIREAGSVRVCACEEGLVCRKSIAPPGRAPVTDRRIYEGWWESRGDPDVQAV